MKRPLRLGEGMQTEQGWHATDCQPIVSRRSISVRRIRKRVKTLVILVGATGFEPATPCAQGRCATRLRYAPTPLIISWAPESHRPNTSHATAQASPRRYRSRSPPIPLRRVPDHDPQHAPRQHDLPVIALPRRLRHRGYEVGEERPTASPKTMPAVTDCTLRANQPARTPTTRLLNIRARRTITWRFTTAKARRVFRYKWESTVVVEALDRFFSPYPGRRGYAICAFFLQPSIRGPWHLTGGPTASPTSITRR